MSEFDQSGIAASGLPIGGATLERPTGLAARAEVLISGAVLTALVAIPLLHMLGRWTLGRGIPGASGYEQHLTLWLTFLGGVLAARYGRHLALSTTAFLREGRWLFPAQLLSTTSTFVVNLALAWGAVGLVVAQRQSTEVLAGGVPLWVAQAIMPLGFFAVAVRFWWRAPGSWAGRSLVLGLAGFGGGVWALGLRGESLLVPGAVCLIGSILLGAPLFVGLGGFALLFFHAADVPIAAVAAETYRVAASPTLPTIPLFALAGTVLAAGGASKRLVSLFRGVAGWMPGGTAVATVGACAFLTAVTGASGVTILALGGLLLPILVREGYPDRFSVGLLTASGSIGLLFMPSLPVILYGIYAQVPIDELFVAGFLPGVLLVVAVAALSARRGLQAGVTRTPFEPLRALKALVTAKWDLFLPVFVLLSIVAGVATLVEAAALTAAYALFIEVVVHRTLSLRKDALRLLAGTTVLVGALLFILGVALGLTSYLVDAEIPARAAEWVRASIGSKLLFLLLLNVFLLLVGALMDIFSAIVVVVPIIVPMGLAFGVDPIHLGIIFLANLELGYLTPPVGLNLFLSSLRFERPLVEIWRTVLPFLVLFGLWVLLITYVPPLTLGLGKVFYR